MRFKNNKSHFFSFSSSGDFSFMLRIVWFVCFPSVFNCSDVFLFTLISFCCSQYSSTFLCAHVCVSHCCSKIFFILTHFHCVFIRFSFFYVFLCFIISFRCASTFFSFCSSCLYHRHHDGKEYLDYILSTRQKTSLKPMIALDCPSQSLWYVH